jgi:hypothetical protein
MFSPVAEAPPATVPVGRAPEPFPIPPIRRPGNTGIDAREARLGPETNNPAERHRGNTRFSVPSLPSVPS